MAETVMENLQKAGSSIFNKFKENPIPSALAGIGLLLYIARRRRGGEEWGEEYEGEGYVGPYSEEGLGSIEEELPPSEGTGIFQKAGQTAKDMWEKSREFGQTALEKARETAGGLKNKAIEHPIQAGILMLGFGFILGSAFQRKR